MPSKKSPRRSTRRIPPLITLTTDFGQTDHFVGVMKGVILGIEPTARIVDLCHEIPAHQVAEASFVIAQAYPYFPPKTVHVAVVDPGVGTARRPLLVEAGGQYFIGPDNGIFQMVLSREPKAKVRVMTAGKYFLRSISRTFHGRDIFAPAAAHVASGVSPARFGKLIDDYHRPPSEKPIRTARRGWTGQVLKVDRFGNLITNFHIDELEGGGLRPFEMLIGLTEIMRIVQNYEELAPGEVAAIVGSSGYLEVVANQASAAKLLGCAAGSPVEMRIF